jgi:hypothetical protein
VTPAHLRLARSALGFTLTRKTSPWNRRFVHRDDDDHPRWMEMVAGGLAQRKMNAMQTGIDLFWLTRAGAVQALGPGETLCPVEFPDE